MRQTTEEMAAQNLAAALNIAKFGIPVFPCGPDKRPKVRWTSEATTNSEKVRYWWRRFPVQCQLFQPGRRVASASST